MKKQLIVGILFILILSMVLAACASPTPSPPPPTEAEAVPTSPPPTEEEMMEEMPDLETIRVGILPIIAFANLMHAKENGYFEEVGLNVELEPFRTGDDMIAPLSLGQLDVGGGESGPALFNAINQDLDVRVVSALGSQPPGHGAVPLLARTELVDSGEISSVADLEGRKVALNVERGMAEYLLAQALASAGLTVDDVEIVTLPFPEAPQALANAAVDAAILPHPLASSALRPGENDAPPIARVLVPGDEITDSPQNGVLYFGQRFLDPANKEVAVRFLEAFLRANRDFQGDDWRSNDDVVNAILAHTSVPEPAVRNAVIYHLDPNGEINTASTEDIQAYHVGRGYTEFSTPLPLSQIIDETFLIAALERIGEY